MTVSTKGTVILTNEGVYSQNFKNIGYDVYSIYDKSIETKIQSADYVLILLHQKGTANPSSLFFLQKLIEKNFNINKIGTLTFNSLEKFSNYKIRNLQEALPTSYRLPTDYKTWEKHMNTAKSFTREFKSVKSKYNRQLSSATSSPKKSIDILKSVKKIAAML